jgi:hypothetical protein
MLKLTSGTIASMHQLFMRHLSHRHMVAVVAASKNAAVSPPQRSATKSLHMPDFIVSTILAEDDECPPLARAQVLHFLAKTKRAPVHKIVQRIGSDCSFSPACSMRLACQCRDDKEGDEAAHCFGAEVELSFDKDADQLANAEHQQRQQCKHLA